jgi:hypothetical protein
MQTGEAAGFAVALARKRKTTPAKLDTDLLVRTLIARGQLVSFFNDLCATDKAPWVAAAQYFGTRGFFASYDVNPDAPLGQSTARIWADGLAKLQADRIDPNALARSVAAADRGHDTPITEAGFGAMLSLEKAARGRAPHDSATPGAPFTRRAALEMMWRTIP